MPENKPKQRSWCQEYIKLCIQMCLTSVSFSVTGTDIPSFLKRGFFNFSSYMCVCVCVGLLMCVSTGDLEIQNLAGSLDLEFQVVVTCLARALGTEPGSPANAL